MPSRTLNYWTKNLLDQFIENPEEMYPDNFMYYDGNRDPWQRACIIEYMQFL